MIKVLKNTENPHLCTPPIIQNMLLHVPESDLFNVVVLIELTLGDRWHGDKVGKSSSCSVAHHCYALRVSAESGEVLSQPVQPGYKVHQPKVTLRTSSRTRL